MKTLTLKGYETLVEDDLLRYIYMFPVKTAKRGVISEAQSPETLLSLGPFYILQIHGRVIIIKKACNG